jgi:hypothetical protein
MAIRDRVIEEVVAYARSSLADSRGRHRRRRKRRRRTIFKLLKAGMWMLIATAVLMPLMIAGGFFYGAIRGLISAPLILVAAWSLILWWTVFRKPPVKIIADAGMGQLPERTEEWIERQRNLLPFEAQGSLDNLSAQLESLTPQLEGLDPQQPAAVELRRLLVEELPELVRGYQRVPRKLQHLPSHGGDSPERHLIDGLATIDLQLARIHERLAAEDLRALATHNRYLELKYKGDKLK